MQPKYILITGSAAPDCPPEKLERAHEFVSSVTEEILRTGNGVTVLAGREPVSDNAGPAIFDWTVLRAVEKVLDDGDGTASRVLARVITGADSFTKRFSTKNARLIQQLQAKNAIEIQYIDESRYSGGNYRDRQAELSDALIAVGGGKGTYIVGDLMLADGKPVMPMDIITGSRNSDGDGALRLLSEMKNDPPAFLPRNHQVVNHHLHALSLEQPIKSVGWITYRIAEILAAELDSSSGDNHDDNPPGRIRRLVNTVAGKTPTVAQTASHTTRTAETIARLFE